MALIYLGIVIVMIAVLFIFCRRPMYEVIMVAFLFTVIITGNIRNLGEYYAAIASNYILYTIMGYIALSVVLDKTGCITKLVNFVIALIGRVPGGAGYVALIASSLFGALSGTGPGNCAAVGVITIPTMKKTGFSPETAAVVECAASAMGPTIPPSGNIVVAYGLLAAAFPGCCTFSEYWVMMWGIALYFILQRVITLFIVIKRENIKPIPADEIPKLKDAWKDGWTILLMVAIIAAPFIFDVLCSDTFITARLGEEGATIFTESLLGVIPSIAIAYIIMVVRDNKKNDSMTLKKVAGMFNDSVMAIAPVAVMVFGGFGLSEVFSDIGVGEALENLANNMHMTKWFFILVIPLILAFLGMFLETLSILIITATPVILVAASLGINPILVTGLLSVMIVTMGHMTPPFALTFNVAMGIAGADYLGMTKKIIFWCVCQYILIVAILAGLPVIGTPEFSF